MIMKEILFNNTIKKILALLIIVAGIFYTGITRKVHIPEFAHYYFGAKYAPEIGYTGLYEALSKALTEIYNQYFFIHNIYAVRNLHDIGYITSETALNNFHSQRWDSQRWKDFLADARFIDKSMLANPQKVPIQHWSKILIDHGYNVSPIYTAYVYPIANLLPLNSTNITILFWLDIILILLTFFLLWRMRGLYSLAIAVLFFASAQDMLTYCTWALLRFDWFFALALAFYFIHRRKYFIGGIFWAIAGVIRLFPMYMAGFFTILLLLLYKENKRIELKKISNFVIGIFSGAIGSVALSSLALYLYGMSPINVWHGFLHRIGNHSAETGILNAIGLAKIFELVGLSQPIIAQLILGILLSTLLAIALLKSELKPENLAIMTIFFIPIFLYLSHYYYLMLIFPAIIKHKPVRYTISVLIITNIIFTILLKLGLTSNQIINPECGIYSAILIIFPIVLLYWNKLKHTDLIEK
ncbi:hypothetical protein DRQ33_05225 [bacterium]|nr:MAG: hypothetical protein DRQ33_05225 [bacterium]